MKNGDLSSKMAAAAGVEPATCSLGESRSIQLSYATARMFPLPQDEKKHSDERPKTKLRRTIIL